MANGDGFSEVGGGGSVVFKVKVKHGNTPTVTPPAGPKGPHSAQGKDDYDELQPPGDHYFEIAIKLPSPGYVLQGKIQNDTLLIYLPISKTYDPDQTKVSWAFKTLPGGLTNVTV